ncbi:MAG: class I SAM-dependent methyltransferase [Candidatus Bathyarchaeota archaeon]|nr:class I SAM-dependent methyltransferase [Candidatus Bathyarchaeota archaeon]
MKYAKKLSIRGHVFLVHEKVYEPAEDTFLLVENLKVEEKEVVLDMGTGCGILAVLAAKKAKKVVATDINPYAIKCAEKNAKMNCVEDKIEFRLGDLFQPIRPHETFSLILFNAPYLPSEPYEERSWIGRAWAGGPSGREVIDRFITNAPEFLTVDGQILLVQSSLSDIDKTMDRFDETGLGARVVAEVEFPFEKIALIEARPRARITVVTK